MTEATIEDFSLLEDFPFLLEELPADYELNEAEGVVVEQLIRPTGLLDPEIEVRPTENQIDDLMEEILVRPGQFCVVYDEHHHRCLGSGEITI